MDDFSSESKLPSEGISTFLQAFSSLILPTANSPMTNLLTDGLNSPGVNQPEALKTNSLRIDG